MTAVISCARTHAHTPHTRTSFSASVSAHPSHCSHSSSLHHHNCLKSFLFSRRGVTMETGHNWWAWNVTIGKCNHAHTHAQTHTHFAHSLVCKTLWDVAYCYGSKAATDQNHTCARIYVFFRNVRKKFIIYLAKRKDYNKIMMEKMFMSFDV